METMALIMNDESFKRQHESNVKTSSMLRLFPTPADLQKLTVRQVVDGWKTVMKRHSGERRAGELLALAARSVGIGFLTG